MKNYIWVDLLEFFERENYVHNGLTIPFLIGTMEMLKNRKMTISELMVELMDSRNQKRITIMKCGNIGEWIIGVMDYETKNYYKSYPGNVIKSFDNLSVTDRSLDDYNDKSDLIVLFEDNYQDKIDKREYSKNFGKWNAFTPVDEERIKKFKIVATNNTYLL